LFESATKTLPKVLTASPFKKLNVALAAAPFAAPVVELPAKVVTVPPDVILRTRCEDWSATKTFPEASTETP
jgi:hypothetical protein